MGLTGKEVLIVDDDAEFRVLLRKVLENTGIVVHEAIDGAAGLEAADRRVPHLILCDLGMPGMSGFEFIQRLKRDPRLRLIPALVLSASDDRASVMQALALGATDYLIKPLNTSALIQKLRKALKSRQFPVCRLGESGVERPTVTARISGLITRAGEAGITFEAPVRIAMETKVALSSKFLDESGLADHPLRTTSRAGASTGSGRYRNDLIAAGMAETIAGRVRRLVRSWK